jgi:hypothetical protein
MEHAAPVTFVSYARADYDFALKLVQNLKDAGVTAWIDQLELGAGYWDRAVQDALQRCERLLVILSPNAVASTSVMDEVSFVLDAKKPVIVVLYRDCKVPFRLHRLQYVDCRKNESAGFSALLALLRKPSASGASQSGMTATGPTLELDRGERRLWVRVTRAIAAVALLSVAMSAAFKAAFWGQEVTGPVASLFVGISALLVATLSVVGPRVLAWKRSVRKFVSHD